MPNAGELLHLALKSQCAGFASTSTMFAQAHGAGLPSRVQCWPKELRHAGKISLGESCRIVVKCDRSMFCIYGNVDDTLLISDGGIYQCQTALFVLFFVVCSHGSLP
jgi:hypothetical protein